MVLLTRNTLPVRLRVARGEDYFFTKVVTVPFIFFAITEDNYASDSKLNCKALKTLHGQSFHDINSMPSLPLSLCMIRNVV